MKYNIETIKDMCEPYGYAARNSGYMLYVSKIRSEDEETDKENWWKPEIFCRTVDDEYLKDEYTIDRFAISFSGYGTLSLEEENKVMENLKKAKELVDKLNIYITLCNENTEVELKEQEFHLKRKMFAYFPNENKMTISPQTTLGHKEWICDTLGYSKEEFNNMVRGFEDDEGVYFYIGEFETNNKVENTAYEYKLDYPQKRVYCGMTPGEIGEKWKPIKEINK